MTEQVGIKADNSKVRPSLIPWQSMWQILNVLEFGARKYSPDNWKIVPNADARYADAMARHIMAYMGGEKYDPESGYHHLAHAACCILYLLWFEQDTK